jgi:hypothetical protein
MRTVYALQDCIHGIYVQNRAGNPDPVEEGHDDYSPCTRVIVIFATELRQS